MGDTLDIPSTAKEPTRSLITAINSMALDRLSEDVVVRAKDLVLDHLGVSLYGTGFEWCRMVRDTIEFEGGRCESSIYRGGLTTARNAALINGTAGHAIELDDAHDKSLSHPGCVVIPAALAVAEAEGATGADFLTAVVAGYEAQCRIGAALSSSLIKQGYHPTAQIGVFGAAAAAAKLRKASGTRIYLGLWSRGLDGFGNHEVYARPRRHDGEAAACRYARGARYSRGHARGSRIHRPSGRARRRLWLREDFYRRDGFVPHDARAWRRVRDFQHQRQIVRLLPDVSRADRSDCGVPE